MSSAHAERLDALLASNQASDSEIKAALVRLETEVRRRREVGSSESVDFFYSTFRALCRLKGLTHTSLRLSSLWECINYFETHGYYTKALEASKHLARLARLAGDNEWLRKSCVADGIVQAEMGNIPAALLNHERAFALSTDAGSQIAALINLAVALNYCALYREAIPCLVRAAELASTAANLRSYRSIALGNLAQCHLYLEEYRLGYDIVREALDDDEPADIRAARSRATREWTCVKLALELGKLSEARERARSCRRYAQWGNNRALYLADIAQALCEVYGGNAQRGLLLLEQALERTTVATDREDVLRALVQAYDEVGQPDRALQYLRALMAHMKDLSAAGLATAFGLSNLSVAPRQDDVSGLRPLQFREARLRAKLAEMQLTLSRIEVLDRLAMTADMKEDTSGAHGYRVGKLSSLLAQRALGWSLEQCGELERAARLHDIGKIGVPDRVLLTPQTLKDAEREIMSAHTLIGAELLGHSQIPQLRFAEEIARCHHEWWNGEGYPARLKGAAIPMHARFVAIADLFDAATHGRPYAKPWPIRQALNEISARTGSQFDPRLVEPFAALILELTSEHKDLDAFLGQDALSSEFAKARQRIRRLVGAPANEPLAAAGTSETVE